MTSCLSRAALALLPLLVWAGAARGQALVADLSSHLIQVTTGFRGAELLLFGAVDAEGEGDVVVIVRGPNQRIVVRRKERVAGIWMNTERTAFPDAPSFYSIASSRPLDEVADPYVLARYQLGVSNLNLQPAGARDNAEAAAFRKALIGNMTELGLYPRNSGRVSFLGNRLFRTDVIFPSNVPTGRYSVTVYLFRDGEVISAQTTPLIVSKAGIGAELFELAYREPAFYGLGAIAMALFLGWLASWMANVLYPKV